MGRIALATFFVTVGVAGLASPASSEQAPDTLTPPPAFDPRLYDIVGAVSADRIEADIRTLVGFGTRHTLSETESDTRGIGAARRWIKAELDRISDRCGGCPEVSFQRALVKGDPGSRIPVDTWVVNVLAVLPGTADLNRRVIMTGDIDSRVSDALDATSDSPGANDNASGMAGVIEAARVLSQYRFPGTIILAGLSGEEQGLFGGQHMAQVAKDEGWNIEALLNNDMIGNIEGIDGVIENNTFRVFSEPTPVTETDAERRARRSAGGEVDGPSRQLARYVARTADRYVPNLNPILIYRLDRFGRWWPPPTVQRPGLSGRPHHGGARELHPAASGHQGGERHPVRRSHRRREFRVCGQADERQRGDPRVTGLGTCTAAERPDRRPRQPVHDAQLGRCRLARL